MKRDSNTSVQFANAENGDQNGNGVRSNGISVPVQTVPVQPHDDAQNSKQQIRSIVSAFRRRWFLCLTLGILFGGTVAAASWYFIPAPFTAFAELHIDTFQDQLVFKQSDYQNFDTYKQTLSRKLKSPFVINSALDQVSKSDLEIIPPGEEPVPWMELNLKVTSPAKEFLRIQLSGDYPGKLKNVVEAVVKSFMNEIEDNSRARRNKKLQDLRKLKSDSKAKLEGFNTSLKQLSSVTSSPNAQQMNDLKNYQLNLKLSLQQSLPQIELEILKLKGQMKSHLDNPWKEGDIPIPASLIEAGINQHPDYLEELKKNKHLEEVVERLKNVVGEKHPKIAIAKTKVKESDKKLESLKIDLRQVVKGKIMKELMASKDILNLNAAESLRLLQAQKEGIEKKIEGIVNLEKVTGDNTFAMQKLQNDILKEENLGGKFQDSIDRLTIESERPSLVTYYREAEVPSKRDVGKKLKLSGIAGFGGFSFIVFGIVFLEYRFRRISSINEVSENLSMKVMGTLPLMPRSVTRNGKKNGKSRSAFWHSALTESIDATRTMLLRETDLESMNVVMVASAMGGEGKTTLTCHLATSLARAGRKTILVDCDLRRPSVSKVYDLDISPGFCEVLRGEAKLDETVRELPVNNLSIIPAGIINQDILGLLAQNEVGDIFNILKTEYDFVIVDSSPILPVTDSLLIAQHVDATILSIRRDISRLAKVGAAVQRMSMLGIPFLGAVAIGLDDESFGFNYPYRYQYGYGYGYRNADLRYSTTRS